MADIFDRCLRFVAEQHIVTQKEVPVFERVMFAVSPIENAGPWMVHDGRRMLVFSTNDYLGMSVHPEVRAVAAEYVAKYGISSPMGARPLTGTIELHLELERQIAAFKGTEAALTFPAGASAMMGVIACLARSGDLLIFDQFAHASLVCGARMSGATIKYFRHNRAAGLERVLRAADPAQAKMVVVDGVYSMNGDIAPLREISDLCKQYSARLFVDDAHGTGVCGQNGRGAAELLGVEDRVDIHAGTFSKAFGTYGGFVAAPKEIIFYMRCLAPTILFTKAMPAAVAAATLKSLELVRKADDRRQQAWANARELQTTLRTRGIAVGPTQTPITPISLGQHSVLQTADILRQKHGVWVSPVVYPAVRRGAGILRAIPTALHTHEDIAYFVSSLEQTLSEFGTTGRTAPLPLDATA